MTQTFQQVRDWAKDRNLLNADPFKQLAKTQEELGELAAAMLRKNEAEIVDGLGDCVVCLTILAAQHGLSLETCFYTAYAEIANRKGENRDGVFVKQEDLNKERE